MNLSSAHKKIISSLHDLQKQRTALMKLILQNDPLVIGSVYDVMRRCGNPYCHCAGKPSHRQTLILYNLKGKRCCRFVRQSNEANIKKAWENYKKCKKALNKIQTINLKEKRFLMAFIRKRDTVIKK